MDNSGLEESKKRNPSGPILKHPIAVSALLARTVPDISGHALIAALLHDTLEDTPLNPQLIVEQFGPIVLQYVRHLTVPENLHSARKLEYQIREMTEMPQEARWIKVADRIVNVMDIKRQRPGKWSELKVRKYIEKGILLVIAAGKLPEGLEQVAQEVFGKSLNEARQGLIIL